MTPVTGEREVWIAVTYDGEAWYRRTRCEVHKGYAPTRHALQEQAEIFDATGARWELWDPEFREAGDPVWRSDVG